MTDEWLRPMLAKRSPDAMRVLCDLLEAGLRKGEVSANDVRDVHFDNPKIIGGVFKLLRKFGFTHTDRRVKVIAKRKHGRLVDVWELTERSKAEQALQSMRSWLGIQVKEIQQLSLEICNESIKNYKRE